MIHLIFLFTVLSGIIQESNTLISKPTPKPISIMYALGSIFFIFWHEPFINLGLIWGLFLFAIIDFIVKQPYRKTVSKINTYFCLVILSLLVVNYLLYFNK
jgi:hypothetical protein